ncbi:MAG: UDP-N-acetylmuramoyl-tripeptide--D-alanyl-D-alanine ligase [Pedosphaera sp.]|nr:UDP-N-acetylmuramoyl-tripeptide--D-alanyl-D-alanine ligase [Pedosphaera sp.]
MDPRSLQFVIDATEGQCLRGDVSSMIARVQMDSRRVDRGDLFVALRGERFDGHNYLAEVIRRGAAAVLINRGMNQGVPAGSIGVIAVDDTRRALGRLGARYREDFRIPMIAVAGSNGKTSVKELLKTVLGTQRRVIASEASFNNDLGVPQTLLRMDARDELAVLEVGTNHPGELRALLQIIRPCIGVLTSLGREHLEHFGDLQGVISEEGTLAESLPLDGLLVVNGDSPGVEQVIGRARCRVVRVGFASASDWRIVSVTGDAAGSDVEIEGGTTGWTGTWRVNVLGRHMAVNAALALALAAELGLEPELARTGLAGARPAKMRMDAGEVGGIRILNDTYNANADSMLAALETLTDLPCSGRRVAVLGDMAELGCHAGAAHVEVGNAAARLAVDRLWTIGSLAKVTAQAARQGGMQAAAHPDMESLVRSMIQYLRPGDAVLVKASRSARLERLVESLRQQLGGGIAALAAALV